MAKKKATSAGKGTQSGGPRKTVTCTGYSLTMTNSSSAFRYELVAEGANGQSYRLVIDQLNVQTALAQKILRVMADLWPAHDCRFEVNDEAQIVDVVDGGGTHSGGPRRQ